MENVSKALIMAGGILISVLLASLMMIVLQKAGRMNHEYENQMSDRELVKFNSQFEIYAKEDNTYFDIMTVANLAYDVNKKNGYDAQNSVEIKIQQAGNETILYSILPHKSLQKNYFFDKENTAQQKYMYDLVSEYGTKMENGEYTHRFKCLTTKYQEATGKVNQMVFKIQNN